MQRTTRLKKPQVPEPGALIEFDDILGRPKYAGEEMTSETDIPSVTAEAEARQAADQEIWTEIEAIEAASDVVDVVGTHAELEAYDTSKLHDKDLIKVLQDETRDDAITYYRFSETTETFSYVGAEGPYYTASETDTLLSAKQDTLIAGSNVQIAADGKTISATDTTYSDFVGATALTNGENGLVPAPLSTDVSKFLQGDGSWGTPTDTTYTAGTNVQISNQNVISATDTTYSAFTGASSSVAGAAGLVPAPAAGDQDKVLKGDGTWGTVSSGTTITHLYYHSNDLYSDSSYTNSVDYDDVYAMYQNGEVIVHGFGNASLSELMAIGVDSQGKNIRLVDAYNSSDPIVYLLCYANTQYVKWSNWRATLQKKLTAGANITIDSMTNTISATDTTYSDFTGATSSDAGANGLVPAPAAGDEGKFLKGDGTWATVSSGSSYTAGNGIDIDSNNEISVDTTVVATQTDLAGKQDTLTAGTGINIDASNVISAVTNNINSTDWNALWQ